MGHLLKPRRCFEHGAGAGLVGGSVFLLAGLYGEQVVGELRQGEVGKGAAPCREEVEEADQAPHIGGEGGRTGPAERQL